MAPESDQGPDDQPPGQQDSLPLTEATVASNPETMEVVSDGSVPPEGDETREPVEGAPVEQQIEQPREREPQRSEPPPRRERPRPRVTVREVQQRIDGIRRVLAGVLDDLNKVAEMISQLEDQGDDMTEELTHLNEVIKSLKR